MADIPEFAGFLPKAQPPTHTTPATIHPLPAQPANSQMAIWSMITSLCSLLCCCGFWVLAPVAIVLGAVALSQLKSHPELTGRGFAISGIIVAVLAILCWTVFWFICFSSPDFMQGFRNAMQQQQP
jgi:hypothetical protein